MTRENTALYVVVGVVYQSIYIYTTEYRCIPLVCIVYSQCRSMPCLAEAEAEAEAEAKEGGTCSCPAVSFIFGASWLLQAKSHR
jgi:hypothetical protein